VTIAVLLPESPLASFLGFAPLPLVFWLALLTFVVAYLLVVEVVKRRLYGGARRPAITELGAR
jgi:Mg2+-importing ATPase